MKSKKSFVYKKVYIEQPRRQQQKVYIEQPRKQQHRKKSHKGGVSRSSDDKAMSEGINFMMKGLSLTIEITFKMFIAIFKGIINGIKLIIKSIKNRKGEQ